MAAVVVWQDPLVLRFFVMHSYQYELFEHALSLYVDLFIYNFYTCTVEILIFLSCTPFDLA